MSNEMLSAVGTVTGEIATGVVKNTSCTMTLEGAAAAVTVLGSVAIVCGTIIAIACIATGSEQSDPQTVTIYHE